MSLPSLTELHTNHRLAYGSFSTYSEEFGMRYFFHDDLLLEY